jgi:hypothetical protein
MDYKHFIITRFNLRRDTPEIIRDKSGNSVLTDAWLSHRIALFSKYCLPSVANQTCKNFLWLIYFDAKTSDKVKQENADLEKQYPALIQILYADGYNDFLQRYCRDILSFCSDEVRYVITSRLDNDDIIHRDFVMKIQENFSGQTFTAVNFVKILMLNPDRRDKLNIDYIFSNHFISLIEKITDEGINGCYGRGDRYWNDIDIIQINDKPYCLEIISDKNLLNSFRGFPIFKKTDLSDFQLCNLIVKNKTLDVDNLKIWKMSWRKYFKNLLLIKH